MELTNILKEMFDRKVSDVILKAGSPVCMRVNGELFKDGEILDEHDLEALVGDVITRGQKHMYKDQRENIICFGVKDLGRFRATIFQQRGTPVLVIRAINTKILTFETLSSTEDLTQYHPFIHPHLFYYPTNSIRIEIWKNKKTGQIVPPYSPQSIWTDKWIENKVVAFPQFQEKSVVPIMTNGEKLNRIEANKVRILPFGASIPSPFIQ